MTNTNLEKEAKIVESIRSSYEVHEETKLERLQKLDSKAKQPALIFGICFGIFSCLILGTGMCLAMGALFPNLHIAVGVVVGLVGIALCIANYFIYKLILNRDKKKYAEKIIKLSNELLGDNDNIVNSNKEDTSVIDAVVEE